MLAVTIEPPADWDSPNPVPFLSATGTYLIALAAPDLNNGDLWIASVFEILEEALLVLGIGAKTSSGYGRMRCGDSKKRARNTAIVQTTQSSLPDLRVGQQIVGIVVKQDQRLQLQKLVADGEHSQFLVYRDARKIDYQLELIAVVVANDQALNWSAGEQRNCCVVQLEKFNDRLLVICEPAPGKNKKKKH